METISVSCTACGHAMKFGADKAGRKAKCPKCENVLTVPVNGAAAPGAAQAEEDAGYGVVIDHELAELRAKREEADRLRQKEEKKKKAPTVKKKYKSLPEAELWEKVHFALIFIFLGSCLWAFMHLLQGCWVALGTVEYVDYARLVTRLIENQDPPIIPERGQFWGFSQYRYLVSLAAGSTFANFAIFCLIVNLLLYPIQVILWFIGYILALPVPRHHGTLGQLIFIMVLGGFNVLFYLIFRVLPTTGLFKYYLIPYFIPEVMLTEYNMERVMPLFMLWSASPFWESLLAVFLQFVVFLEPILGVVFLWTIAKSLKDDRIGDNAAQITAVGFGQYFFWVAFLMIALCGTTPVLVWVLRVLYIMWYASLMMFIVRYALLTWRIRDLLAFRLYPEG
jgi:hypothetical protein